MVRKLLLIIAVFAYFGLAVYSQQPQDRQKHYYSVLLDSFDDSENELQWIVRGSRYLLEGFPEKGYINSWPVALHGWREGEEKLNVLGVEAGFSRRGYNYLEIIPARRDESGNLVENAIVLPRNVNSIDLWVWGSNYAYELEVQIRDYRGLIHTLPIGSLRYLGWRNLTLDFPNWVPRKDPYSITASKLEIVKFVLWTQPQERVSNFFVYFDNLKAVMEGYDDVRDGGMLSDQGVREELWSDQLRSNE